MLYVSECIWRKLVCPVQVEQQWNYGLKSQITDEELTSCLGSILLLFVIKHVTDLTSNPRTGLQNSAVDGDKALRSSSLKHNIEICPLQEVAAKINSGTQVCNKVFEAKQSRTFPLCSLMFRTLTAPHPTPKADVKFVDGLN